MNIKEAKEQIKQTIDLYLTKDENGDYLVPLENQRPVYLVGAPGLGKTAIMKQIASEMEIAFVSYSMTHHTRQSAVGLPYLADKEYDGRICKTSEYTMSEIIASVYDVMKKSGQKKGILFLDEINCVSETLAPSMLLFLQFKRFGNEQLPPDWIVVTAGNPPEFNKSVKEFDVATLDRLKYIELQKDFGVWQEYAAHANVHPAIQAFLKLNENCFHSITTRANKKIYATARGWEDLSKIIRGYEQKNFAINSSLIMQYITNEDIARKFAVFYDLFSKYQQNYSMHAVLDGDLSPATINKAKKADFDERISVVTLLSDLLSTRLAPIVRKEKVYQAAYNILKPLKRATDDVVMQTITSQINAINVRISNRKAAGNSNSEDESITRETTHYLYTLYTHANAKASKYYDAISKVFNKDYKAHEANIDAAQKALSNAFDFVTKAWGNSEEMVLFVANLTMNTAVSLFVATWGSDKFQQNLSQLFIYDQEASLKKEIEDALKL